MIQQVQSRMARGALWMVLFKFVERGLGLISTLILARLLSPGDFGVVAMAISFIAMAELLSAFSFDVALIQSSDASAEHFNSAWTCNVLLGLTVALAMASAALPISDFYRKPELFWVILALSFGPLFNGLENIGVVAFRKELDFRREFQYQVTRKFLGFIVVVPLAFVMRNHWALVVGILFSKASGTAISYLMHPFRPRVTLSKARQLLRFSRWLLLNNLASFLKERSSDFFIGRSSGAAALGTYNIAYELSNLPTTEISAPINRALLPGFAKIDAVEQLERAYVNALGLLALVALPASAIMFALAPYLVLVILGTKWLDAIPLMEVLPFNGALLLFHSSICAVLFARGFAASVTLVNSIYAGMLILLLTMFTLFGQTHGVVGAAYAALGTSILCTPLYLWQLKRNLHASPLLFLRAVNRPVLGILVMSIAVRGVMPDFSSAVPTHLAVGWVVVGTLLAVTVYVAAVLLAWALAGRPEGAERIACEFMKQRIGRQSGVPDAGVKLQSTFDDRKAGKDEK
jgi:PST family polysaccharide transporter